MKKTLWHVLLSAEALVCILLSLVGSTAETASALFAFPLVPLSEALRTLSLSGTTGNCVAIVLFVLSGLTPLLLLLPIRRKHRLEDALPCLLCAMVWLSLYAMINPAWLKKWFGELSMTDMSMYLLNGCALSLAVAYIVLRVLRSVQSADSHRLLHIAAVLLKLSMALLVFAAFYPNAQTFRQSVQSLRTVNASYAEWTLLCVQLPVSLLPYWTDAWIAAAALRLTDALPANQPALAVQASEQLSRRCVHALVLVTLTNPAFHLLQLLLAPQLHTIHISIEIPLFSVLLTLAALLVSSLIHENKRLRDDSALFI